MMILDLIFGFLLVLAGRNLFWLCVGIVGFLIGVQCAELLGYTNGWMALLISFFLGGVGVVLAVSFEWFMVIIGVGFLGGGYILMSVFPPSTQQDPYTWLIFVVGGIVGMCLMVITFDWTLILISSILGSVLIVNAFHGREVPREFLFIGIVVTGIVAQYLTLRNSANQEHTVR